jgi:uncharacterized protein YdeI (BOF family)
MKRITSILVLILGVTVWFIVAGCGRQIGIYGKPLSETKTTAVAELFKEPDKFAGKTVRVEGKIVQECPTGGWFMLKDDTGIVFVNLHPSDIAIPQAINHQISAQGKVKKEYNQVSVIGEGVDLK